MRPHSSARVAGLAGFGRKRCLDRSLISLRIQLLKRASQSAALLGLERAQSRIFSASKATSTLLRPRLTPSATAFGLGNQSSGMATAGRPPRLGGGPKGGPFLLSSSASSFWVEPPSLTLVLWGGVNPPGLPSPLALALRVGLPPVLPQDLPASDSAASRTMRRHHIVPSGVRLNTPAASNSAVWALTSFSEQPQIADICRLVGERPLINRCPTGVAPCMMHSTSIQ